MPRYRVLRDFGSHLGNHARGEYLTLPEGPLPRGFAGFVERVAEGGVLPPPSARPEPEEPPTPASRAEAGYDDKMLRASANTGHGHVRPRPDGVKARCGGPGLCPVCSKEQAALKPRRAK